MGARHAVLTCLVGALAIPCALRADAPAAGASSEPVVAIVTTESVNLRVGPRTDDSPILQLDQGAVVVIVERAGEWLGVHVPAGFQAAISAALTEPVDAEHVRVTGTDVNLRVRPPSGDVAYTAFRDRVTRGQVLPVIAREGEWLWVEAPEEVRAYVHSKYVKELGPASANASRIEDARKARAVREKMRAESAAKAATTKDDAALRDELGAVGIALIKLRAAGGYDNTPVGALVDRLTAFSESHPAATDRTKELVRLLTGDLEREMTIRTAYADQIAAYKRLGKEPPPFAPPPAQRNDRVDAVGVVHFEPVGGWEGGGMFVLARDGKDEPYALRWSKGDLKTFGDGSRCRVSGKTLGGRLLGLIVLEVDSVTRAP